MARQKHFRLPDDVLEMINNRDKEIYPTENVYITESVRNFFKKEETCLLYTSPSPRDRG